MGVELVLGGTLAVLRLGVPTTGEWRAYARDPVEASRAEDQAPRGGARERSDRLDAGAALDLRGAKPKGDASSTGAAA